MSGKHGNLQKTSRAKNAKGKFLWGVFCFMSMSPQSSHSILTTIEECGKLSTALATCLAKDTSPSGPLSDVQRHVGPVVASLVDLDGDEEKGTIVTRVLECFVDEYRNIHGAQAARDLFAQFVSELDDSLKEG